MLHFNASLSGVLAGRGGEDSFKVLILDRVTKDIIAPLLHVNELRRHGVTLHLLLDSDRQPIPDVPAVYFVEPTAEVIDRISADASKNLYESLHLNFTTHIPRPLMERLASNVVKTQSAARISHVYDQHAQFIALERDLFSLGLPSTYVQLNDPRATDVAIESAVSAVVEGLFCVLSTLAVVPIIRCPPGGAAEHVASALDARLRDALKSRNNVFTEGTASGLMASLQRPLLCLFDRTFELSVTLQHAWTYKPLVHDVMHMRLNRLSIEPTASSVSVRMNAKTSYEMDEKDFFWQAHGKEQFPKIAEQVEAELAKYKAAVEELNRTTGANIDPSADAAGLLASNTKGLMSAVSSLPQLTERKRVIDKHTNVATALLNAIKSRALDQYYQLEEDLIRGNVGVDAVVNAIRNMPGTAADKMRLALVWLLTVTTMPSESDCSSVEAVLGESLGGDTNMASWMYIKRMRRMNLAGKGVVGHQAQAAGGGDGLGFGGVAANQGGQLASFFGQGLTSLTKGVKNLLAGEQQAAVTVAVESLMDGKPNPETDGYAYFDPKGPAEGRRGVQRIGGPFKEALVFMIGGGNYLEHESLACWAARSVPGPKNVIYGATELLHGEDFLRQLEELGTASGAI
jgi:hypothetical protein